MRTRLPDMIIDGKGRYVTDYNAKLALLRNVSDVYDKHADLEKFVTLNNERLYLVRWMLFKKNDWFNVYLHAFGTQSTEEFHDHPYNSFSLILRGSYRETFLDVASKYQYSLQRTNSNVYYRRANIMHKVDIDFNTPTCTIFIVGRRRREWGFLKNNCWVHYLDKDA